MNRRVAALVAVGSLFVTSSCETERGGTERRLEYDSAGISITVVHEPQWREGTGWVVDTVPQLSIGAADGPVSHTLHGTVSVEYIGEDVLVGQQTDIRRYNRTGPLVRTYGRAGSGPGEFSRISSVAACPETLFATDLVRPALIAFDWSDTRTHTVSLPPVPAGSLNGVALRRCTQGVLFATATGRTVRTAEPSVTRAPIYGVRLDPETAVMDTLLEFSGREVFQGLAVPFGRSGAIAFGDSLVHVVDTGEPQVRVFDTGGSLRSIIRLGLRQAPVSEQDVDRVHAQYLEGAPPSVQLEIQARLDVVSIPSRMPFFSASRSASDGTVWIRNYQPFRAEPVREWQVISADGDWLGGVRMPKGFEPHVFTEDAVLGVTVDEFGVEQVREHAIRRGQN